MSPTFTPDAAQWLLTEVLPPKLHEQGQHRLKCPCQYGPCGWCSQRELHDRCPTFGPSQHRPPSPETYITSRRGHIASGIGILPAVWVGKPCVWVCACRVCREGARPVQLDLFELIGASS